MSAAVGLVMGVLYAVVTLGFKAEQGISGIGVYLFGLGFSELLYREKVGTPLPTRSLGDWRIPLLGRIPKVGDMFFDHTVLVYVAFAAGAAAVAAHPPHPLRAQRARGRRDARQPRTAWG